MMMVGIAGAVFSLSACHSAHVDVSVENRTGEPVRLLEVDYPNASFGSDSLAADTTMHYRIQIQGSGPVKVQYSAGPGQAAGPGQTAASGPLRQAQGPVLAEHQEGSLQIVLLPGGKAEFRPRLSLLR
jgi:hypothetical protein